MHIHKQNTAADVWYINHNMGQLCNIEVLVFVNNLLTKVYPNRVVHATNNTAVVEFTKMQTGVVNVTGPNTGTSTV